MEENEIINNTEVFKSYLCDYNDAYILVRDDITAATAPTAQVPFNNCAPFIKCITKINEKTADDAEDLNLVMLMYNLIKCRSNYSEATGRYDFIQKMKQLILMLILLIIILNLLNIRLNY